MVLCGARLVQMPAKHKRERENLNFLVVRPKSERKCRAWSHWIEVQQYTSRMKSGGQNQHILENCECEREVKDLGLTVISRFHLLSS